MSQQQKRCKAEEWHRDGRGMWAMRACAAMEQHGGPHVFLGWTYNVQPPAAEASAVSTEGAQGFNFWAHLQRQRAFSERTFGPGARTAGVVDHIRKELREIEVEPGDLREWVDVAILALDGAWRAGFNPDEIIDALVTKQARNEARQWPDWRTAPPDKAIEHVKAASLSPSPTTSEPTTTTDATRVDGRGLSEGFGTAGSAPKGSER